MEANPEHPSLLKEAFILAIQTKFQLDLYEQHASTILCIDSTHGTKQYRFKLLTIVAPDDLRKGSIRVYAHRSIIIHDSTLCM